MQIDASLWLLFKALPLVLHDFARPQTAYFSRKIRSYKINKQQIQQPKIIINLDAVATPEVFKNINMKNVNTFVNLIKYSDLQDLHKIFKSFQSFNTIVNEYNLDETNTIKVDEFDYETLNSTEDTIQQIIKKFADFKLLLLIFLKQFKVGTICPGGLII